MLRCYVPAHQSLHSSGIRTDGTGIKATQIRMGWQASPLISTCHLCVLKQYLM